MTKRKALKQLRKRLSKSFVNAHNNNYCTIGAIRDWIEQSDIEATDIHVQVLLELNGSVFYPYQKEDRKRVRKLLKDTGSTGKIRK